MSSVSQQQKDVADYISSIFETEKPSVFLYWDDDHRSSVHVLDTKDCPQPGVTSYSTVGLSEHPLFFHDKEYKTRVELVGACGSNFQKFGNILATSAFCVINSRWFCAPGMIFPGIMEMHQASVTMSDVYFASPFLWDDRLKSIKSGNHNIAWLLVVPISRKESLFAQEFGPEKLESLFIEKDIDIFNLNRPSVI